MCFVSMFCLPIIGSHADHGLKQDPVAVGSFLLMAFLKLTLYFALISLNLKPTLRKSKSEEYWRHLIAAEIYGNLTPIAMLR